MLKYKKIASVVFNPFTNDNRVAKGAKSLAENGYIVEVVAHLGENLKVTQYRDNYTIKRFIYFDRKISISKLSKLIIYFKWLKRVVEYTKTFDIIHCNDLNTLPIGVIIKRFYNKNLKIVYDAHEYEINDRPNEGKLSIKVKYFLEKSLIRYADRVITVSDSIADEYVKLYNIKKPALVLNTPSYKIIEKRDIFREKFNISRDKTIFLYQGGLDSGRGIEIILETFKELNNINAVIIFMGYGELENIIKETSKKYSNIYFHPAVNPDILLDYTSSADFGILFYENNCLNHYYCSPNKMFEYLMAKIPVIASNLYEMKRLIESNSIGVVAEKNTPQGLREAIERAIELDKRELQSSIQRVREIYNWEEQEKVLLQLYKELT